MYNVFIYTRQVIKVSKSFIFRCGEPIKALPTSSLRGHNITVGNLAYFNFTPPSMPGRDD
jgi:hypothetical protein